MKKIKCEDCKHLENGTDCTLARAVLKSINGELLPHHYCKLDYWEPLDSPLPQLEEPVYVPPKVEKFEDDGALLVEELKTKNPPEVRHSTNKKTNTTTKKPTTAPKKPGRPKKVIT